MSLYAEAVKEKYGQKVHEDEQGFFTYSLINDCLFIEEFFISPKFRSEKKGVEFLNEMIKIASENKVKKIIVSIFMNVQNDLKEATMFVCLKNKFKLSKSTESHIYLQRGL